MKTILYFNYHRFSKQFDILSFFQITPLSISSTTDWKVYFSEVLECSERVLFHFISSRILTLQTGP